MAAYVAGTGPRARRTPSERASVGYPLRITIEVTNGLDAKDAVIVMAPDGVQAGMTVKPGAAPKPKGA